MIPDMDKVIKGLTLCEIGSGDRCYETECPYYKQGCTESLKDDILELLKEQGEQIKRLEHDLAVVQNNLNYYVNGND